MTDIRSALAKFRDEFAGILFLEQPLVLLRLDAILALPDPVSADAVDLAVSELRRVEQGLRHTLAHDTADRVKKCVHVDLMSVVDRIEALEARRSARAEPEGRELAERQLAEARRERDQAVQERNEAKGLASILQGQLEESRRQVSTAHAELAAMRAAPTSAEIEAWESAAKSDAIGPTSRDEHGVEHPHFRLFGPFIDRGVALMRRAAAQPAAPSSRIREMAADWLNPAMSCDDWTKKWEVPRGAASWAWFCQQILAEQPPAPQAARPRIVKVVRSGSGDVVRFRVSVDNSGDYVVFLDDFASPPAPKAAEAGAAKGDDVLREFIHLHPAPLSANPHIKATLELCRRAINKETP